MEKELLENTAEEVVKTNKVDWKGLGVIGAIAAAGTALTVFAVKKIKAVRAAKSDVKPEEVVTEAEA